MGKKRIKRHHMLLVNGIMMLYLSFSYEYILTRSLMFSAGLLMVLTSWLSYRNL